MSDAATKSANPKCWLAAAAVELWNSSPEVPAELILVRRRAEAELGQPVRRGERIQADDGDRRQEGQDERRPQPRIPVGCEHAHGGDRAEEHRQVDVRVHPGEVAGDARRGRAVDEPALDVDREGVLEPENRARVLDGDVDVPLERDANRLPREEHEGDERELSLDRVARSHRSPQCAHPGGIPRGTLFPHTSTGLRGGSLIDATGAPSPGRGLAAPGRAVLPSRSARPTPGRFAAWRRGGSGPDAPDRASGRARSWRRSSRLTSWPTSTASRSTSGCRRSGPSSPGSVITFDPDAPSASARRARGGDGRPRVLGRPGRVRRGSPPSTRGSRASSSATSG